MTLEGVVVFDGPSGVIARVPDPVSVLVVDSPGPREVTGSSGPTDLVVVEQIPPKAIVVVEQPSKPMAIVGQTSPSGVQVFTNAGPRGPQGPPGAPGTLGELDVDPLLMFENALI